MDEMRALYQDLIIDHGKRPRHFGKMPHANHVHEGYNPLCGDHFHVYLHIENEVITEASFDGVGCAISTASASLMMEAIRGKTLSEASALFKAFHAFMTEPQTTRDEKQLGKLIAFSGVVEFPMRIKCATLCWHTMQAALHNNHNVVSTE